MKPIHKNIPVFRHKKTALQIGRLLWLTIGGRFTASLCTFSKLCPPPIESINSHGTFFSFNLSYNISDYLTTNSFLKTFCGKSLYPRRQKNSGYLITAYLLPASSVIIIPSKCIYQILNNSHNILSIT